MICLGLRTDGPTAHIYLYRDTSCIAQDSWQADRQLAHGLLGWMETFLAGQELTFDEIDGLFVYSGPGSFTGLRIGITVFNTMAATLEIPIVGETGDGWAGLAVDKLTQGSNDQVVLPFYGAEAKITKPRK